MQETRIRLGNSTIGLWDWVPMWVSTGMTQESIHPLDHQVRDGVFEVFGLSVDFVPFVAEGFYQKSFNQPVPPDHVNGVPLPQGRQGHRGIGSVIDQSIRSELTHRIRNGREFETHAFSKN